ncbi:hypothetical protein EWM64_g6026 [Hericium alpestre]|uniref:Uncharacterized protein n=1 Tax=Hericium alpestre TaxID=135208 RepID=A0A4Y9ZTT2_9AGAM|nr:hypothetical protein EWM64_g6026 [Hericium alpestre]
MVVADPTTVKVYTVNGAAAGSASSLPDWLTRKRAANGKGKRVIREQVEGTIELIQHFEFPEASNHIKTTRDGHHVIATGTYKPQMRVWDLDQLSLKFERHSDSENVEFIILSDDWTKTLHLQADRTIELHTQGGFHYRTRIPRFGRSLAYHFPSCDALIGASGNEVYRLNLDQGRFLNPLSLGGGDDNVEGVNAIDINSAHGLWSFGLDGSGTVEFWDHRSRSNVGTLRLPRGLLAQGGSLGSSVLPGVDGGASTVSLSVTALSSKSDGLSYAVGTSTGHTLLYDIRSPRAFATKDQGYGLPVKKVMWMEGGSRMAGDGLVLSADKKVVKIWDRNNPSANFASLTPASDLNDIHHVPGSGLLMTANEGIQMTSYYIPQLGPAPRWCSFVENLTEEMEEGGAGTRGAYEDFKFVSRAELTTLGLDHLVGTPALKPYMHGYFISLKLYDTARVIANPYVYEEQRDKMVQAKLDKLAEGRIRARKGQQSVKVNKALASASTSVAPLVQFFELVHIGDMIQSIVQVYFDKELAPHVDVTDFLNSVVREKKRFENVLDDSVAKGLNAGIEVLMNQEHIKLLKGNVNREVLEVFEGEVGERLIAILHKHIKRQIISLNGGFQIIADLNEYSAFVQTLKIPSLTMGFAHLKMLGSVYIVEDAKDLAQIVRDVTRYGGSYRPEDLYEFVQRRSDWKKIEKIVDKTMYNLNLKEDCVVC